MAFLNTIGGYSNVFKDELFYFFVEYDPRSLGRNIVVQFLDQKSGTIFSRQRHVIEADFMIEEDIFLQLKIGIAEDWENKFRQPFPWGNYGGKPQLSMGTEDRDNFNKI